MVSPGRGDLFPPARGGGSLTPSPVIGLRRRSGVGDGDVCATRVDGGLDPSDGLSPPPRATGSSVPSPVPVSSPETTPLPESDKNTPTPRPHSVPPTRHKGKGPFFFLFVGTGTSIFISTLGRSRHRTFPPYEEGPRARSRPSGTGTPPPPPIPSFRRKRVPTSVVDWTGPVALGIPFPTRHLINTSCRTFFNRHTH